MSSFQGDNHFHGWVLSFGVGDSIEESVKTLKERGFKVRGFG